MPKKNRNKDNFGYQPEEKRGYQPLKSPKSGYQPTKGILSQPPTKGSSVQQGSAKENKK